MLLILKFLAKTLSVLNGEISAKQIAAGFAFGALIGLIPAKGLLPFVLLIIGFLININIPMMMVGAGIFKLISFVVDPVANTLGFSLLVKMEGLKSLWTDFYNAPIIPYTNYNNTIVMGSLVIGILLLIPLYFLSQWGVHSYRNNWRTKIMKFKIVQVVKSSRFYRFYETYKGIRGE